MACKKCKDKKKDKTELLYIMNPRCGWCIMADTVVEDLRKDGYNIITLDITKPDAQVRANEVKTKYNAQCGTPLFIDAKDGNMVCGFKEKDVLEKWAKGEKVPPPPPRDFRKVDPTRPQNPQNPQNPQQPTIQLVKLEYIWVDGHKPAKIRSKVRFDKINTNVIENQNVFLKTLPSWSFDGSSTGQADVDKSDMILKPVRVVPNTTERTRTPSFVVLCEVYDSDDKPHSSNKRAILRDFMKSDNSKGTMFGIEQEFIITNPNNGKPFGWEEQENNKPRPQGDYYCGVGADVAKMRDVSESHAMACNTAGVSIKGTNAEVMLSQWEYQLSETDALSVCDNLWYSRFFLQRIAEKMNLSISYAPKLIEGDEWNGSGAHINFSTEEMRKNSDDSYMVFLCSSLGEFHEESFSYYGIENDKRLTGKNETSNYDVFTFGEMDRSASIRIPGSSKNRYLEDRRPAANIDPYEAVGYLLNTFLRINEEMLVNS